MPCQCYKDDEAPRFNTRSTYQDDARVENPEHKGCWAKAHEGPVGWYYPGAFDYKLPNQYCMLPDNKAASSNYTGNGVYDDD